jgi:hypothetical protein
MMHHKYLNKRYYADVTGSATKGLLYLVESEGEITGAIEMTAERLKGILVAGEGILHPFNDEGVLEVKWTVPSFYPGVYTVLLDKNGNLINGVAYEISLTREGKNTNYLKARLLDRPMDCYLWVFLDMGYVEDPVREIAMHTSVYGGIS